MKTIAMLMLVAAVACGRAPSGTAPGQPAAKPSHVSYALEGLITGRRIFFNEKRCLAMLKAYADAMEVGLGQGGGAQLKCVPIVKG